MGHLTVADIVAGSLTIERQPGESDRHFEYRREFILQAVDAVGMAAVKADISTYLEAASSGADEFCETPPNPIPAMIGAAMRQAYDDRLAQLLERA